MKFIANEDDEDRNGLIECWFCCCCCCCVSDGLLLLLLLFIEINDWLEFKLFIVSFSLRFFLFSTQLGQNHLPFGAEFKPTHTKWNHCVSHLKRNKENFI